MLILLASLVRTRSARLAATCAAGVAIAALAGIALHLRGPAVAQRQWRAEISQAPSDEVPALLEHLTEQGDVGLDLLVELLDDDRGDVAQAAERVLQNQMQSWRTLPTDASSRKVAALAEKLAVRSEAFRSTGRYVAAQLAGQVIDWPLDEEATDVSSVLAHCEVILRAAPVRPDELMHIADRRNDILPPATPITLPFTLPKSTAQDRSPWAIADALPGGGLTVDPRDNLLPAPVVTPLRPSPVEVDVPPRPSPHQPPEIYAPLAIPLELAMQPPATANGQAPSHANTPSSIDPRATADLDAADLTALSDVELMRALHDAGRQSFAEDELRRRGFDALRLEVARRLTDADPNVRKALANALPQVAGVDAAPWLKELAADSHPDVRRVAIAILATDPNEQVHRWLHEFRHDETDPRVAELIDGILQKRR